MPVGGAVKVFLICPSAAGSATRFDFGGVPVVGVNRGVGRVGFIDHLQYQIKVSRLSVENVHSGVCHRDVDVASSFSNNSIIAVGWRNLQVGHCDVFVVHFNDRDGVVLSGPTKVVPPSTKGVVAVANGKVRCGGCIASELPDRDCSRTATGWIGKWAHVATATVGKRDLCGRGVVEVETRFSASCGVRGVFLISDRGVHKVSLAIAVQISNTHGIGNVGAEVGIFCVPESPLSGRRDERDVFCIGIHHGDGVNVSITAHVSNGEILGLNNAELDDGRIRRRDVGRIGAGGASDARTGIFHDGHVVDVSGVRDRAAGVINAVATQKKNVVIGAGAAKTDGLCFTVVADFNGLVDVLCRNSQEGLSALSC